MSQHDYDIANAAGAAVRTDLNLVLAAIISNNSATTAPTTTVPYMLWANTTTGILNIRNAADTAWVALLNMADPSATATAEGLVELLNQTEMDAGTDTVRAATAATIRNHSTLVHRDLAAILTKGYAYTATALTYSSSITPDLTANNIFTLALTGNTTIANPTVIGAGSWVLYVTVDATGGRTLAWGTNFNEVDGEFDGAANVVNIITILCDGSEFDVFIRQRP